METTIREDTSKRHASKYQNKNHVHQLVLGRFLDAASEELSHFGKGSILDFGCGEAFFWKEMAQRGVSFGGVSGIDLREDALEVARNNFPGFSFINQDILTWEPGGKFDLLIASQVLEHLPNPGVFLEKLVSLTKGHLLLTVPWEPFFRLSNLARGRDIMRLGNHPEHINLWGAKKFEQFVSNYAQIVKVRHVFPFLMLIASPKASTSGHSSAH